MFEFWRGEGDAFDGRGEESLEEGLEGLVAEFAVVEDELFEVLELDEVVELDGVFAEIQVQEMGSVF